MLGSCVRVLIVFYWAPMKFSKKTKEDPGVIARIRDRQEKVEKRRSEPRLSSYGTGYFFICPASGILHPGKIALGIMRGPKGWAYFRCGECRTHCILGYDWKDAMGLTAEQAAGLGAEVRRFV